MKRRYEKPTVNVEQFELAQSIAAGCRAAEGGSLGRPGNQSQDTCGWVFGEQVVWTDGTACNLVMPPDIPFDGVCYNNPCGGMSIFAFS